MGPAGLDPQIAALLPRLTLGDPESWTPKGFRERLRQSAELRSAYPLPAVRSVEDVLLDLPKGARPARVYRPHRLSGGTVLFIHGGGWVGGDLDTQDRLARRISIAANAVVVSVDYRRPPEAVFPAAFDDCLAAARHVFASIYKYGGNPTRFGIAGDSAGGNLAAAVSATGLLPIAAQLLLYPAMDMAGGYGDSDVNALYASRQANSEGYYLTMTALTWFARHYVSDSAGQLSAAASPLRAASFAHCPPSVIGTAEFDPLRDEGQGYGHALRKAGIPLVLAEGPGLIHGYASLEEVCGAAAHQGEHLRRQFARWLNDPIFS